MNIISCLDKRYGKKKNLLDITFDGNSLKIYINNILLEENKDFWLLDLLKLKQNSNDFIVNTSNISEDGLLILVLNFSSPKIKPFFSTKLVGKTKLMEANWENICTEDPYLLINPYILEKIINFFSEKNIKQNIDFSISLPELQELSELCLGNCIHYQLGLYFIIQKYCNNKKDDLKKLAVNLALCLQFLIESEKEKLKNTSINPPPPPPGDDVELKQAIKISYTFFQKFIQNCFNKHGKNTNLYFLITLELIFKGSDLKDFRTVYNIYDNNLQEEEFINLILDYLKYGHHGPSHINTNKYRQAIYRFKNKICNECKEQYIELLDKIVKTFISSISSDSSQISEIVDYFCK